MGPVKIARNVGKNENTAGIESELDIEFIGAISNPIPLAVWYSAEYSLLAWVQSVASNSAPGYIHSVSYGNDERQQTSTAYMQQVNTQFMQAGAKGISILFASGDQGVWGRSGHGSKFNPDFPGASPYITTVGGTDFATYDIGDETAWDAGGGGFSDTFAQPSWQADAVKGYLASPDAALPPASFYNASGRAYPDVAALGCQKTPYCVASSGRFQGVAGTSASCPVVAGIFGLLNNARLAAGNPQSFHLPERCCLQRCDLWKEQRWLWEWLHCRQGLGRSNWLWNSRLYEAPCCCPGSAISCHQRKLSQACKLSSPSCRST